jgi:hypothetical protein
MNAILRDDSEAIVLTNEAIEVHLSYLRPAVEALGDKLDQFNQKLDDRFGEVNKKIDDGLSQLSKKIDDGLGQAHKKIDDGLGQVHKKIERLDDKLGEMNQTINRHDKEHIERVSKIQASLDGLKWFVSSAAILASGVSIAHSLGWI